MIDAPAIRTHELAKRYGSITALAGLTMTIPRGDIFGFLGPNGAGKTTAVKLLLGLTPPTSGDAEVLGAPIGDREALRRVGYLPELFRYQSWLTAREVLVLHCELAGIDRAAWQREIEDALAIVGLSDRGSGRVATFSKGMQQRLGLGVALLGAPDLVVLDEPTSALDPVGRRVVRDLLRDLRERGIAVVLSSHLLSEVELVCDRVAILVGGEIVARGTPAELARPRGVEVETANGVREFPEAGREDVPRIVADLVASGESVYGVRLLASTLEDAYLEAVGAA